MEYVCAFPSDKRPSLVHAYQRSYPEKAAKLTQQHVTWLREYEAELAGRDLPDAMHCLCGRAKEYVYRKTGSRPAARAFWGSSPSLCCHLSALGHWHACMYDDKSYHNLHSQTHHCGTCPTSTCKAVLHVLGHFAAMMRVNSVVQQRNAAFVQVQKQC